MALLFVLLVCYSPELVTAQSTEPEQRPPESSLSVVSFLSSLSDDLVTRLTERDRQSQASVIELNKIRQDAEAQWKLYQEALDRLQKEHQGTLNELSKSETDYADLKVSSLAREALDQQAIDDARSRVVLVGAGCALGGLTLGFLATEALHLFKIIP